MRSKHIAILLLLTLAGCAGAVPWNPQGYAGINKAEIVFNDEGTPTHIIVWSGKEQQISRLEFALPNGLKAKYYASGVKAFRAAEVRAAVEQSVSADVKAAAPGIVDALVKAIMGL